ncbi:Uncharacterised protein [Gordonia paraffinivorans]|uniref:Uncharacterized protein n=1 Tax=Gordonia paraffinivorans TaxID=175628 RepID=A0ABD7V4T7_9ACTN|nr:hypothetical protein [Gordonia paraffinivorans]VFA89176.1 Uncharacterised protein [Gordonia paraffinivorans]
MQFRRNHMQKLRDDPMMATLMAIEIFNEDTQTARKAALVPVLETARSVTGVFGSR